MCFIEPTAVQAFADVQETPDRTGCIAAPRLMLGWKVQLVPFHCSASDASGVEYPTALQAAAVQETLDRTPVAGGFGVDWIAQPGDASAVEAPASQTARVTDPATTEATREPRVNQTIDNSLRHTPLTTCRGRAFSERCCQTTPETAILQTRYVANTDT